MAKKVFLVLMLLQSIVGMLVVGSALCLSALGIFIMLPVALINIIILSPMLFVFAVHGVALVVVMVALPKLGGIKQENIKVNAAKILKALAVIPLMGVYLVALAGIVLPFAMGIKDPQALATLIGGFSILILENTALLLIIKKEQAGKLQTR